MAFSTQPPKNWDNLQNKPDWIVDNQANWGDIPDKPVTVLNWLIDGGFTLDNNYRDLGAFPLKATDGIGESLFRIFVIQFNIQLNEYWYNQVIGSKIASFALWTVGIGECVEQSILCERHANAPALLTFFWGTGNGYRNLFLKSDQPLIITSQGRINVKIASII